MGDMRDAGTVSVIDVLDVERQRLDTEQRLAQAQAEQTNAFMALQKSLGLVWQATPETVVPLPRPAEMVAKEWRARD
ncbi:outer membrane protein TolC [Amorphus sp. MBR-141]